MNAVSLQAAHSFQEEPLAASPGIRQQRNRSFDVFRIVFSLLVLLAHAAELTDGNKSRELLARLTHTTITFGTVAVDGFFLLSGFLIARSWDQNPSLPDFLRKRLLRIVPGYLVAVALSTVIVGLLAPGVPHFFRHINGFFYKSVLALSYPATPPVYPGAPSASVNGALWTINYEFRCYLLVAAAGMLGLLRKPRVWLAVTVSLLAAFTVSLKSGVLLWPAHLVLLLGTPFQDYRLVSAYFVGVSFYVLRDTITFAPRFAAVAAATLALSPILVPSSFELAFILAGGYLLFYAGQPTRRLFLPSDSFPDVSYGIYLYGWPVESLLIWFHHGSPWVTFGEAALLSVGFGWLSWHFVERPMLTWKVRSSAPLPPG